MTGSEIAKLPVGSVKAEIKLSFKANKANNGFRIIFERQGFFTKKRSTFRKAALGLGLST